MIGPICISALSLFVISFIVQIVGNWFNSTFNLLANRGVGKILFTGIVILHILMLLAFKSRKFVQRWIDTNIVFIRKKWIKSFFLMFGIFFLLHSTIIGFFVFSYQVLYVSSSWNHVSLSLLLDLGFGFVATFFLAWTEELIFRGTLYPYFAQNLSLPSSIMITSIVFMFAHNISSPFTLITTQWKLGVGFFLIGVLLNIIFAVTEKLYFCMGAHAGLVFVKVILRRIPFIAYPPENLWAWWFAKDLRESPLTHLLFIIVIMAIIIQHKNLLLSQHRNVL
jgi:membrane protease YdiL (CAAX protease family)